MIITPDSIKNIERNRKNLKYKSIYFDKENNEWKTIGYSNNEKELEDYSNSLINMKPSKEIYDGGFEVVINEEYHLETDRIKDTHILTGILDGVEITVRLSNEEYKELKTIIESSITKTLDYYNSRLQMLDKETVSIVAQTFTTIENKNKRLYTKNNDNLPAILFNGRDLININQPDCIGCYRSDICEEAYKKEMEKK